MPVFAGGRQASLVSSPDRPRGGDRFDSCARVMKKLRLWIIKLLGGVPYEHIPRDILVQLLSFWARESMDKDAAERLRTSFRVQNIVDSVGKK